MAITKDAENVVTIKVIGIGGAGNNQPHGGRRYEGRGVHRSQYR